MASRYIANHFPRLLTVDETADCLSSAVEDIIINYPPRSSYPNEALHGLWSGPTGIAYLLLQVSTLRPSLLVQGEPTIKWAEKYIDGSRGNLALITKGCGIGEEKLAFEAVRAAVTTDFSQARNFISSVSEALQGSFPNEMLYGRAGTLYLLRMIRHWLPDSSSLIEPAIVELSNQILRQGPNWKWHGQRYLGAVHGDIGIVTQLVLTRPSLAPELEPIVERLLSMQLPDGNWPSSEGHTGKGLVQFCHGAPGFVISLVSLRPYFSRLHNKIDLAVQKGRECIWNQGLLKKEPSLCHGIFGNALAFPPGPQRNHFLAIAMPENLEAMKQADSSLFERADYGRAYSALTSYGPSAAWAWLVCEDPIPRILAYNDI
ncbi:hypothetical protein QBC46DRAFT_314214 [Diplogelasinospora grovesii]|uniref:Uncharacterized protein n=1 Tax=Diplogelasinospora grovesii TaxID=303347 RepID=A0AAN6N7V6_9PEZI|nr:hypothetical protein QBC46DRAFT_314214 [Diplogelasinospora grovesii]